MTKYNDIEIQTAKRLRDAGYKWLARTMAGNVVAFSYKPHKKEGLWLYSSNSACNSGKVAFISGNFTPFFQSIKWEDKEPTYIEDIISPQILDDVEKRYLSAVIKPFRGRVKYIKKIDSACEECIYIQLNGDWVIFPHFRTGTMYKGMEQDKMYSLEELGL